MLETDEPLCQIACACGFADQAHLTRLFGARVGQTPLRWRKAGRRSHNMEFLCGAVALTVALGADILVNARGRHHSGTRAGKRAAAIRS